MKRLIFIFTIIALTTKVATAQSFYNGANIAEVGVGLGGGYGTPLIVSYERGIFDLNSNFTAGVGGMLGVGVKNHSNDLRSRYTLFGAVLNIHYCSFDRTDLFGGLTLGAEMQNLKDKSTGVSSSYGDFLFDIHIGGRYYFNDYIAAMMQLGVGAVNCKLGVSLLF